MRTMYNINVAMVKKDNGMRRGDKSLVQYINQVVTLLQLVGIIRYMFIIIPTSFNENTIS